ncbi:TetR/AcrR family transcriptional regulator [Streptomyces sp. NBC_01257]|uniref:TetR/AcrR family transcriptional regulator n=1 Tax=Streptomyces sp. NBC_01257 TaxID=2903799 RepID=UPI002DD92013|nr:TetR family transcriptional regulator [Streptomyces sp. NBC_01257]WRZ65496.1 TetR family transcriptional regulator [Streptomyces sp. NBC_01257]
MATRAPSTHRRSDATKAAILEAARERFAADGYERATIRSIARDANIDPSMVMRYYGNKEGLFAAASVIDLRMPELGAVSGRHIGAVLVGHFLDRWERDDVLTALLRVGATNETGAGRMRAVFAEQLGPVAAAVCPDPAEAPRRAALVTSQLLGMALARYVLRIEPAVSMDRDELIAWLAPVIQRYLTAGQP